MTFMASYDNYPGAYALKALHEKGKFMFVFFFFFPVHPSLVSFHPVANEA